MLQSGGGLGPHPGGNLGGHQLPGREAGAVQGGGRCHQWAGGGGARGRGRTAEKTCAL